MKLHPQNPTPGVDALPPTPAKLAPTDAEMLDLMGDILAAMHVVAADPSQIGRHKHNVNNCYAKLNHLKGRL